MNIRNLCKITDDLESDKAWEENYTDKISPSPAEEVSNDDAEVSTEDDDEVYQKLLIQLSSYAHKFNVHRWGYFNEIACYDLKDFCDTLNAAEVSPETYERIETFIEDHEGIPMSNFIDFDEDSAWVIVSPKKMWAPNPYKIRP